MADPLITSEETTNVSEPTRTPDIRLAVDKVETLPLQGILNIQFPTSKDNTQMTEVWNYLKQNSQGDGDLLYQFRQIENKLSTPKLGETRLGKVYDYVRLQEQAKSIEDKMQEMSL